MPAPTGTGFFVSGDGWFVTAAHVVTKNNRPDGPPRDDIEKGWLMKEARMHWIGGMCQGLKLDFVAPEFDIALLKLGFSQNANKSHLTGKTEFPHLTVSTRQLQEGEPVYAFGYPLSEFGIVRSDPTITVGHLAHSPRTTSAIVAATMDKTTRVSTSSDPQVYVLDKALNYGNSGGPIVAVETGHVHAICSRFLPTQIPQPHLEDANGQTLHVAIPSLYGIVSSLGNAPVIDALLSRGVRLTDE
jgi:hypothetical protein